MDKLGRLEVEQLKVTSTTPPADSGFYKIDETTMGVVGDLKFRHPKTGAMSSALTVASNSDSGVGNRWDVPGISAAGHVVFSALPILVNHLPATGNTYSRSAYPALAQRLGRVANGLSAFVARTSAADNSWVSVCWSPELSLFVAVANSGTGNRVMTSPDGINWTSRTSAADNSWFSVCWSPELSLFVAVAISVSSSRVLTSPAWVTGV